MLFRQLTYFRQLYSDIEKKHGMLMYIHDKFYKKIRSFN